MPGEGCPAGRDGGQGRPQAGCSATGDCPLGASHLHAARSRHADAAQAGPGRADGRGLLAIIRDQELRWLLEPEREIDVSRVFDLAVERPDLDAALHARLRSADDHALSQELHRTILAGPPRQRLAFTLTVTAFPPPSSRQSTGARSSPVAWQSSARRQTPTTARPLSSAGPRARRRPRSSRSTRALTTRSSKPFRTRGCGPMSKRSRRAR